MNFTARGECAARLNAVEYVDSERARMLLEAFGPDGLFAANDGQWAAAMDSTPETAGRWRSQAKAFDLGGEARRAESLGARIICWGDAEYPSSLAECPDAPLALTVCGKFSSAPGVAIVGSRVPTEYGRRVTRRLSGDLAAAGAVIVSGLARGIDTEGHRAAMKAGGTTWAVLGAGLTTIYPPENRDLAREISDSGGCVISEYPTTFAPRKEFFPRRNRIIAGLSRATVLVEGRIHSGALSTAAKAGEYGREVFAVPGPVDSPLSAAPHKLLRDGARLAFGARDILEALPRGSVLPRPPARASARGGEMAAEERRILQILGSETLSLDEISQHAGLDINRLSLIMFGLEVKEIVVSVPGHRYAKKDS